MKKLRSSLIGFLFIMIFVFVFTGEVFAYDYYETPIRVHIGSTNSENGINTSISVGSYQVLDGNGTVVKSVSAGNSVTLTKGMVLSSVDGSGRVVWNGTEYRGDLLYIDGNVINRLGMEQYLYSVVMKELGGYAPHVEALKAQAVACRNFAYRRLENPRSDIYDIFSTSKDQTYGGFTGERFDTAVGERVRNAVDGTAKMVMYFDGKLVEAYYCANAGGASENVENVWGNSLAYLKGIDSPWDAYPFVGDAGTYSSMKFPTSYEWVYTISFADLAKKVVPSVGAITDVKVSHDGCFSGYAKNVTIYGTDGNKIYTGAQFRSLLGLRSSNFDVMIGKSVVANRTFATQYIGPESFDSFLRMSGKILTINGKGYGHSVGMSQWGACVMADRGYDYRYILNYFYNRNQDNGRLIISRYQ